jgi:lipopolysaccharide/colanic/teichoic acid biosynthesis glycosyltransferase
MENGTHNGFSHVGTFGGGYQLTSVVVNRLFNIALAAVLVLVSLPLFVFLVFVVLLCDGFPVFYKGTRMGLNKKPFTMYKFRTLVADAEEIIGAKVFTTERDLMTPFGKFFRDTRLDELPQLFNVLWGNMDFVGPRPVRPAIYESICKHIPNYDRRFSVAPGLIGYAQLFTPHSAPKRIRTLIDNTLVRRKRRMLWDVGIVFYAIGVVLRTTSSRLGRAVYRNLFQARILRRYKEKRGSERVSPSDASVLYYRDGEARQHDGEAELVDLNERAFLMRCSTPIAEPFPSTFRLKVPVHRNTERDRRKHKTALCKGKLFREIERVPDKHDYVIEFEPTSPLNYYMVHQYFLVESLGAMV